MSASTMIVKVSARGKSGPGLMRYLYGPGQRNEHTNQHAVFATHGIDAAFPGALRQDEAGMLGRIVEASWRIQMREQLATVGAPADGISSDTLASGAGALSDYDQEHMYHLIVSLPPDRQWTDEQWSQVGWELVKELGFSNGPDDENGCKVVGVRHGLSAGGNDHMHIAINLVREDGRRVQISDGNYFATQDARRAIEQRLDFVLPLQDRGREHVQTLPAYTHVEAQEVIEQALAQGKDTAIPDRVVLQQVVRAAAVSSATEEEFIYQIAASPRQVEIDVARWAAGGRDEVTGYKVRLSGHDRWFTASQLAPDLTLQKLRPTWADNETASSRAGALALWREEKELEAPAELRPFQAIDAAAEQLEAWAQNVARTPPEDVARWDQISRDHAGLVSILAQSPDRFGEELQPIADTLARQALPVREQPGQEPLPRVAYTSSRVQQAARNVQIAVRSSHPNAGVGWTAVLQQIRQVGQAIAAAQNARQELNRAQQTLTATGVVNGHEQFHRRDGRPLPGQEPLIANTPAAAPAVSASQTPDLAPDQRPRHTQR